MIDKFVASALEAVADVKDGMTVLIGGFGQVGTPNHLIEALCERGCATSRWSPTTPAQARTGWPG